MESSQSAEIASTSVKCHKGSPAGSKTPESPSRCRSPGSPIGDDACPICLGAFTDKCAAGSCLHNFCLVCLKEWAKQRPVCPLCKQSFTKILYDIKSETDYKEWEVPVLYPSELNEIDFRRLSQFLDTAHRRFFSYRSTLTGASRRRQSLYINSNNTDVLPSLPRSRRQQQQPTLYHERGSSLFRLSIYTNNVWIQPLSDITGRYRESNPHLYREQPALTHRLVPWVNRELAALLPASRIGVVLSAVMDLIEHYPINGREFRRALRPYLGSRTPHFLHEFYNFARSPYDMIGHDNAAHYVPRYDNNETDRSNEDSDDDDDVIEIESDDVVVESEPLDLSSRVAREETIGNDGSVFISSDSESSDNDERNTLNEETHNPEPPYYLTRLSNLVSRTRNLLSTVSSHRLSEENTHISNNLEEPGPSGISSGGSLSVKKERNENRSISDSEDCLIVDILKPKKERTPELINLSSESDEDGAHRTHWKKKMSKQADSKDNSKHSKNRKKPRLDRTSFSLHFSGTLNCKRGEDHTYCTESASPCNPGSNRTESEDDTDRLRKSRTLSTKTQRQRWNRVDSDSDSNSEVESPKRRLVTVLKRQRSSRSISFSPAESSRKVRKDQKSMIKSSSKITRSMSKASGREIQSSSSSRKRNLSTNSSKRNGTKSHNTNKRTKHHRSRSSSSSYDSSSSCTSTSSSSSSSTSSSSSSSISTSSNSCYHDSDLSSCNGSSSSRSPNSSESASSYHPSNSSLDYMRKKKTKKISRLSKNTNKRKIREDSYKKSSSKPKKLKSKDSGKKKQKK